MKDLTNYITEKYLIDKDFENESFIDSVKNIVELNKCDISVSQSGNKDVFSIKTENTYSQVSICIKTDREQKRIARAMYTSSKFENEPCVIRIIDWKDDPWPNNLKNDPLKKLSKTLFNNLYTKAGLEEATDGKTAQWGTWKFAVRSQEDENLALKYLDVYCKGLKKLG